MNKQQIEKLLWKIKKLNVDIIVLKPESAWRVDSGSGRPGAGIWPGWRKNKIEKT